MSHRNNIVYQGQLIRVLIIEDNAQDAELMTLELKEYGFHIEVRVVDDKRSFISELRYFVPDVILCDYNLPEINGMESLSIAQEEAPDIPFIFVTGTVGEEIAAETILNGASGLILKPNLSRLPELIGGILEEKGKWLTARSQRISQRISNQVRANIEALSRIENFLGRRNLTNEETHQMNEALTKLRNFHTNLNTSEEKLL